ncbi:MAG: VWA domain-containing protein [Planctomycetes bacterium]|nr:VWA domain-containing protein [Planctomycetota bacterium]
MQRALPELRAWLAREWPGVAPCFDGAERFVDAVGRDIGADAARRIAFGGLPRGAAPSGGAPVGDGGSAGRDDLPTGSERQRRRRSDVERIELEEQDDGHNPLAHVFEKVRTAEEHTGGRRAPDGSDELAEHGEALDELDLRSVVRSKVPTRSVFRADVEFAGELVDLEDEGPPPDAVFSYDEWDERRRNYLPAWCAVREAHARGVDPGEALRHVAAVRAAHARALRRLCGEFRRLLRGNASTRRQPSGGDVDIDAVVDRHGDLRAAARGRPMRDDGRLYVARRPSRRDVAVTLLLDRSLSSDSWVANRRVLDVTRTAVVMLADVLRSVRLPAEAAAFCSHTRRDCRYDVLKTFDAPWSALPAGLFALEPDGYTRIGPALRHAAQRLARRPATRRLLVVLSDCKPVDHDHYEGRRGIGDVRQAVREARRDGIDTVALAVDRAAGPHLAAMFGAHGFRVLPEPDRLAEALTGLHERLLRP